MNAQEKDDIRAMVKALYVQRNRYGRLDGDADSRRDLSRVVQSQRYTIPHGGADTVDQIMMLLQCMIGDEPTSVLDGRKKKRVAPDWDTSSLAGMERTAKNETDKNCNVKIGDHWLEVIYEPLTDDIDRFKYKWGKNFVERKSALEVFKMR